jgi:hypothetical protein
MAKKKLGGGTFLVMGGLAIFLIWAYGVLPFLYQFPSYWSAPTYRTGCAQAAATDPKSSASSIGSKEAISDADAKDRAGKQSTDQALVAWTAWLAVATGVLAFATLWVAYIAFRQLRDNDNALKLTQRAYLSVEPDGLNPLTGGKEGRHILVGHIRIRNVGHVPARQVSRYIKIEKGTPDRKEFDGNDATFEGDNVIVPNSEMALGSDQIDVTDLVRDDYVYIWGQISYDNGFSKRVFTKFCHRYPRSQLRVVEGAVRHSIPREFARYHEYGNDAD